ncbi:type II toxin-antitoxin system PemK/MazF family toxin [Bifidobacterium sp. ESL0763]|uniref:type II toxin-antitoxin system PemK/MazF family toxin n=1 Tax=Bifidobacterium sp. ESL0763 TaxID=2983227 RepID=UPI0023F77477|nr:type II toxin-antitoxin system PemK/MazF family toxin [Bifidobacterium sp. ESL0763]MDF7663270.1 type II toxin-antitoxin system PemK/MazF family toxin [Bifidobacterium sp. ESL0763]
MSQFRYGDLVWMNFDPSLGHEQKKRRPAVVVSNDAYNRYNNVIMVVPISHAKEYPLHVDIGTVPQEDSKKPIHGWAEVEQLKSLDVSIRNTVKVGSLDYRTLSVISARIFDCLRRPTTFIRDVLDAE